MLVVPDKFEDYAVYKVRPKTRMGARRILNADHFDPAKQVDMDQLIVRLIVLAQVLMEMQFYPYQVALSRRIMESLLLHDGDVITSLMSRQSGKTSCIGGTSASLCLMLPILARQYPDDWRLNITDDQGNYRGFMRGLHVGIYAPKLEQSAITFERVKKAFETKNGRRVLQEMKVGIEVNNGNTLAFSNGSRALCQSASKQSEIEGATHHLLVAEEAQDIDDMKTRKCFSADTEFLDERGKYITIEQLVKEQRRVLVPTGDKFVAPVEYHVNGVQPCFEITTDSGKQLTVTEQHRHLIVTRTKHVPFIVITSELQIGDRIAVPSITPVFGPLGTKEEGYFLGSILGDGCVTGGSIQFIGAKSQWRRLAEFAITRKCGFSLYKEVADGIYEGKIIEQAHMRGTLITWLRKLGVWGCKGREKYIPNRAWSQQFLRGLISGLFETDGCVERPDERPCISFANISKDLVLRLRDYLLRFGIHATFHTCFTTSIGLPGLINNTSCTFYRLHIKCVEDILWFAKYFDLGVKQDKLNKAVQWAAQRRSRQRSQFYPDHLRFECIKTIESVGEKETYCVSVDTPRHLLATKLFVSGNSLHPMISSTMGTMVKIGTASVRKCDFYNAIQHNRREEVLSGRRNHFFFPWTICAKYNSLYRKYIEGEKRKIGEQSDEFKMAYNGIWIFERGMFITQDVLFGTEVAQTAGLWSEFYPTGYKGNGVLRHYSIVAGIDWGRSSDSTVVTLMGVNWLMPLETGETSDAMGTHRFAFYKKHIVGFWELQGDNYEYQFGELYSKLVSYPNLKKIVMDSTACGLPMYDRFAATFGPKGIEVSPFVFSSKSKSDGYKSFAADFWADRITFPAGVAARNTPEFRRFVQQMLDLKKDWNSGVMKVSHPDERGARDDYPDSSMMAAWGCNTPSIGGRVEFTSENPFI